MVIPLSDYYSTISQPASQGRVTPGRHYPGFADNVSYSIAPGQPLWLPIQADDMLSYLPTAQMSIAAIAVADGSDAVRAIIPDVASRTPQTLLPQQYDGQLINARLRGLGLHPSQLKFYTIGSFPLPLTQSPAVDKESVVWRATQAIILILVLPATPESLVSGNTAAAIDLQHRPAVTESYTLPPPLGKVIDEWTIKRGTAHSYQIPHGAYVQIIDCEGRQCSDFMAFNRQALDAGHEQHIDSTVSRTFTAGAYPRPGLFNKFYDSNITPLLEVVQDTIGRHDTFALACTARGYEERGFPGHINCSDNISVALAPYNIAARPAWPAINFFFNSWILPTHNQLQSDEAWSRPGDYVLMKALTDLVAVSTACPDDIDPINGWHPTDIHVRLYAPTDSIKPSIAYRLTPNEPANMTTQSPFHQRTSCQTQQYAPALDYWVPQYYEPHGAIAEYWACRESVTMQDMSNLRIYDICGTDALPFLQKVMTRDINRLALNKGRYALICDESGSVIDDGTLFSIGPNLYRWTCGSGESLLHLKTVAQAGGYHVFIRDMSRTLCTLSVQGPLSGKVLQPLLFIQPTQPAFANISWFGGAVARLHHRTGVPLYVSRTGYSGELGYELFCANHHAEQVWDSVATAGKPFSIMPMGAQALNLLRVESGLMARGNEFGNMEDPYECGLGFAVDTHKQNFIGAAALARNRTAPRRKLVGLVLESGEVACTADAVYHQRYQVGRITSAIFSPNLQKSIAMAIVNVEHATTGTELQIGKLDGHAKRLSAVVCSLPFIDPQRERPRALSL